MDSRFWLWVIIAVVSLIFNMVKKKRERDAKAAPKAPFPPSSATSGNPSKPAPMSFEELLAEIQGNRKQDKPPETLKPVPVETTQYTVKDYDDEAIAESNRKEKAASKYDYRKDDEIYAVYEKAKQQAFTRPSLEETMKLSDTQMKFGAFAKYQKRTVSGMAAEIAKDFRNPSTFRKAFIMNEILQRRF